MNDARNSHKHFHDNTPREDSTKQLLWSQATAYNSKLLDQELGAELPMEQYLVLKRIVLQTLV